MATLTQLATSNLALKGAGDEYNYINRFFATKAEADAALADGSWTPEAGKLNACLTGDQGLLVYNEGTSSLDLADEATRAYVDAQIGSLVDGAPGTLDTLNELAAAINDNPNYFTDAEAARQANTNLINAETSRATAAEAAIQADVDQNEADADAADAALDARLVVLETDPTTATAVAAVQSDVDQNEADADAADTALGLRIDAVEAEIDTARTNIYTALGQAEGATAMGTFTGSTLGDGQTIKALLQQLETATETEISDRQAAIADILDGATFTGDILFGALARLKESGNEFKIQNDAQSSSIVLGPKISLQPATGSRIELHETVRMPDGTDLTVTGAELNFVDGVTSNVQTQLDAIQADVDQNESDADAAIAAVQADVDQNEADADAAIALKADIASPTFTGTPSAPTASAGTNTTQLATTAYVDTAVAALIDSSPAALDTLNELAAAIGDDANFSTTITNNIAAVQADVNQNELDGDNADAALSGRLDTLEADPTTQTAVDAKLDASAVSAYGLTLVDDADAATARTTLGLGTAATTASTDYATAAQGATADAALPASDVSAFGSTLIDDADAAAARTTLGLGTAATTDATAYATAAQGATADAALAASAVSAFGLTLVDDADAATARTTLGVDAAGTDNSTDVTLAGSHDYITISGQEISIDHVDLADDVTGALPISNGGTGSTTTSGAQAALSVDHLITLSGVAEGSDDFGTFTGSTIGDNLALKAILQAVETAVEARLATTGVTTLLSEYANDGAAQTGGVPVGGLYYDNNGHVRVRLT